ncbi:sarcosine oxidase subunit delta [Pseudomonas sp. LB-090624]|uniref:sarcosine oxidase subunit delta n=1 Tax=Pseudomonas sp. LB-090624 TaxID=2213079 RepID=UPI000D8BA87A|nr:sarcosine oxidase subunit delta [Pseudomonas sp. LB-090624]PYB81157.1 sarcosine oxidase subunit delta [Pseudomonas sp. LB-090624]
MKILTCPLNGPRNISEFTYGGELKHMPDPASCSDAEWADHVFNSDNLAGVVLEWWLHNASSYWFLAERHTVSDQVLRTFDPRALFDRRVDFAPTATAEIAG